MMRDKIYILLLLLVFSGNNFAGDMSNIKLDISKIKAAERQLIIKELTYHLDAKKTCEQTQVWSDKGSGADLDGYFFIPSVDKNFFIIGGYGTQNRKASNCVLAVREPQDNPENTPNLLVAPIDWKLIWKDKGSGAHMDGSMWEAVPPDSNYKCIGSIPQAGYKKPALDHYRCVHISLTEKVVAKSIIWSDKGSGADKEVTMFKLPNTGSFVAVGSRIRKLEAYDLKPDATGVPDPKLVEEKLAMRMESIQQDLAAKVKEKAEQKRRAEQAERERLAEEVEQKRQLEQAEQMSLDEQAKQKRLAEETERKRLAGQVEHKQQTEVAAQEPLQEKLDKTEVTAADPLDTTIDIKQNESTGLNSLIVYLFKIVIIVIGLMMLPFIIYRLIRKP